MSGLSAFCPRGATLKIELRNVKYFASGSEETACFTASIYVDGKKAGTAQNHGTGGPTMVNPFTLEKQINDYAATLPLAKLDLGGGDGKTVEYKQTAEHLIDDLLTQFLIEKDLRSALSKRVIYTKKDTKGIFQSKALTAKVLAAHLAHPLLCEKWNIDVLLNALPFGEALVLFKAQG